VICDQGTDLAGGGEQGCRLGPDDEEIIFFTGCCVICRDELCDFAFGDNRAGIGKDIQHSDRVTFHHQAKGTAKQEVPDQHAGLIAPDSIGGLSPAPQIGFIDDIVMEQCGGVDEFNGGSEPNVLVAFVSAKSRACERQQRSQALAAGSNKMTGELGNEGYVRLHSIDNELIDPRQIGCTKFAQIVECVRFCRGTVSGKTCDNGQNKSPKDKCAGDFLTEQDFAGKRAAGSI